MRGLFIAFEGIEGAGKSTQVALLSERLRAHGQEPLLVREPGGTALGEESRRLLLHGDDLGPAAELFLFLVARADLVARVIRPALEAGRIVVADRYELSTRAYQAAGRGLPEQKVKAAIALATGGLMPDLYVVLDVPIEAGRSRQTSAGKSPDRMERSGEEFHRRVADAFRAADGANIAHLKAEQAPAAVGNDVWALIMQRFGKRFAK
jgi:dTMP kinase